MALFGWFVKTKKKQDGRAKKRGEKVPQDTGATAASAEGEEHEKTASSMTEKPAEPKKILVIGCEDCFSEKLADYSVSMAKRHGFEIVALNITAAPLSMPADKAQEAAALFLNHCMENVSALEKQAQDNGLGFIHLVEIGRVDEVVEKLHVKYPDMRYVLTEPDPEEAKKVRGKIGIHVFHLGSYHSVVA